MSLPHRCLFLSDLHLGTGRTRARALLSLLQQEPSERVVLVGDILDLTSWQQRQPQFSPAEWQVLQGYCSANAPANWCGSWATTNNPCASGLILPRLAAGLANS